MEKIPSMEYTSKEGLEFIKKKKKDKDVKADYFRQIEKDVAHITKNSKNQSDSVYKHSPIWQWTKLQNLVWFRRIGIKI